MHVLTQCKYSHTVIMLCMSAVSKSLVAVSDRLVLVQWTSKGGGVTIATVMDKVPILLVENVLYCLFPFTWFLSGGRGGGGDFVSPPLPLPSLREIL